MTAVRKRRRGVTALLPHAAHCRRHQCRCRRFSHWPVVPPRRWRTAVRPNRSPAATGWRSRSPVPGPTPQDRTAPAPTATGATDRVPGAVTDEKPKAEVFRIELILVAFEVHLRDQAGKEHVAEPDEAGDRGAILMRRLLVVADVAHGAEQDVLVDAVLVDDFAAVHRAAAAVDAVILAAHDLEAIAARQVQQAGAPHVAVDVGALRLLVALVREVGVARQRARQRIVRAAAELQLVADREQLKDRILAP